MSTICPHCGVPSAGGKAQEIKAWTGKRLRRMVIFVASGLGLSMGAFLMLGGVFMQASIDVVGVFWIYFVAGLLFAGPGGYALWRYFVEPKARRTMQRCGQCQHEWIGWEALNFTPVACPHCTRAIVVRRVLKADAANGEPVTVLGVAGGLVLGVLGLILAGAGLSMLGSADNIWLMVVVGIGMIGYGARALWQFLTATRAELVQFHCPACKQKWSTLDGQQIENSPQPQAG